MIRYISPENFDFFDALASKTRLEIVKKLCEHDMNIKELADSLNISSSIMTKHIRKLEEASIITTSMVNKDGSRQKMCMMRNTVTEILPLFKINRGNEEQKAYEVNLPIGHYTDIRGVSPCGIATAEQVIGGLDEPRHLLDPERMHAQLLWIGEGYVEYQIPNHLGERQAISGIEVSGEFGSEVAGFNDEWPSKIIMSLNGREICSFTTPGDFGSKRGTLTPGWWISNQYGILVVIRVNEFGVYVNGERKSNITIQDFDHACDRWVIRFEVGAPNDSGGGLTIFGEKFGNYDQNILLKAFYRDEKNKQHPL